MTEIHFDENLHKYTRNNREYISVTTLIGKYEPHFDVEYWSLYKAIQRYMGDRFHEHKRSLGGFQHVVPHYQRAPFAPGEISNIQQQIQNEWKAENRKALEKGSRIHERFENKVLQGKLRALQSGAAALAAHPIQTQPDLNNRYIFPEVKLYNDRYRVAGMADLVLQINQDLHIRDYKTNKKISKTGFQGEKMLYPLDELDNCNFSVYTMQLSTYGWMLEKSGYRVQTLEIYHIRDNGSVEPHKVPYRPDLVVKMLEHYDESKQGR